MSLGLELAFILVIEPSLCELHDRLAGVLIVREREKEREERMSVLHKRNCGVNGRCFHYHNVHLLSQNKWRTPVSDIAYASRTHLIS